MQSDQGLTVLIWAAALGSVAACLVWMVLSMRSLDKNYQLNKARETQEETWQLERERNLAATKQQEQLLSQQLLRP